MSQPAGRGGSARSVSPIAILREIQTEVPALAARFLQALKYQRKGLLEQAFGLYQAILEDHPSHVGSLMNCGIVRYLSEDMEGAARFLEQALELEPENADALYNYGKVLTAAGRLPDALAALERSLELVPGDPMTTHEVARLCLRLGRFDRFFEAVTQGLEADPHDVTLYLLKAQAYLERGDSSRATDLLNLLLHNDPSLEGALTLLAEVYTKTGRHDRAVACLKRALLRSPDSADLHKRLGVCYMARGDRELARAELARAREIDPSIIVSVRETEGAVREEKPESWDAMQFQSYILSRSEYYARTGAWRTAINEFLVLARKYSERPIVWQELAASYQNAGEYRRAYTLYRKVLEMEPQNLEVQLQLSRLALAIGQIAEARRFSEQTAASYPEVSEVAEIQGQVYLKMGDVDGAKKAFLRALEQSSGSPEALIGLGTAHFRAGEYRQAQEVWERAHRCYPGSIQIALSLAEAYVELGQNVAAIKLLRETKNLAASSGALMRRTSQTPASPDGPPVAGSPIELLHRLGGLYLEAGWPKKARAEWKLLLEIWNGDPRDGARVLEALLFFREVREGLRLIRTYLKRHPSTPNIDFLMMLCHVMQKDQTKFWISWQKVWKERPDLMEQRAHFLKAVLNRTDVRFLLAQMPRTHQLFSGFPEAMHRLAGLHEFLQRIEAIEPVTELHP